MLQPQSEDRVRHIMAAVLNQHDYLVSALEAIGRPGPPEFDFAVGLSWSMVGNDTAWPEDVVCGTERYFDFPPGTALLTLVTATDAVLLTPRLMQALNRERPRLGGVFPVMLGPVEDDAKHLDRPVTAVRMALVLAMAPPDDGVSPATTHMVIVPPDLLSPLVLLTHGQVAGCPR